MSATTPHFPGKHGASECIRLLLHYGGEKLGELRDYVEKWLKNVEDGIVNLDLHHAVSVAHCIGKALGLVTNDHWTDAKLDSIALIIYDILKLVEEWHKENDKAKRVEMLKHIRVEVLKYHMGSFEKTVIENGGFFGKKLTWLDFFFVAAIEVLEFYLGYEVLGSAYPALLRLTKTIWELPEVKNFIKHTHMKK